MLSGFKSRWGRSFRLADRVKAYVLTFRTPTGTAEVLPDLAEFCHAAEPYPAGSTDQFTLGRWMGRYDVWRRISDHLHLTEEEMYSLLQGRNILKPEDFNR